MDCFSGSENIAEQKSVEVLSCVREPYWLQQQGSLKLPDEEKKIIIIIRVIVSRRKGMEVVLLELINVRQGTLSRVLERHLTHTRCLGYIFQIILETSYIGGEEKWN